MTDDAASTTADMLKVFNDMPPSFFEGVSQALSSPVSSSSNPEDASSSPPLAPPCPSPTTNKDINTDASTNQPSPAHPTVAPAHDMENQARDEFDAAAEVCAVGCAGPKHTGHPLRRAARAGRRMGGAAGRDGDARPRWVAN